MLRFLLKGLLRDTSRSKFPVIVIVTGVMLTVFLHAWMGGFKNDMVWSYASFQTGHVKIMSKAYSEQADQFPNDLALLGIDTLMAQVKKQYPNLLWTPRIRFGGLLDIPDATGETRAQGPAFGIAIDLFGKNSPEPEIFNLDEALMRGKLPQRSGEILLSDDFAKKLGVELGEIATLISSTMYGGMALQNFKIAGTVRFGVTLIDRGAIIADLRDMQRALDMENAAGEILGFFGDFQYHEKGASQMKIDFNWQFQNDSDPFSPQMLRLRDQNGLAELLDLFDAATGVIIGIFIFVMFIILWNAGLMGSLRRYGEIGVRLAIGENKGHVYRSLLFESLMIGIIGSVVGTALGLAGGYYLQMYGIDFGAMMRNSTMLISNIMRAQVTTTSYYIGFVPGILATLLGTAVAGIGIYRRQTSQLFKELEV
ncbi:MAG: ABC transporter permease [bacterium]